MLETLEKCPLCETSGHFSKFITTKDFTVSKEDFSLVSCDNCSFVFTNPRPQNNELSQYYASANYISHSNKSTNLINGLYKVARKFTLRKKIKLINTLSKKGKLLDVGCGTGHFLKASKANGWVIFGAEPDPQARKIAAAQTDTTIAAELAQLKETNFDVITLWHVLEHIPDVNNLMRLLKDKLNKNGKLIIAVPNYKSYDAQYYKKYWAAYDVPRHLYHFEQATMKDLAAKHSLSVAQILPMKLDSFYVSLLSESYKGKGPERYINFLLNGCKSNRYANNNTNNYSSLIYIITHTNA